MVQFVLLGPWGSSKSSNIQLLALAIAIAIAVEMVRLGDGYPAQAADAGSEVNFREIIL
jgi:hypothetical protein